MLQTALADRLLLDLFFSTLDGFVATKVDVSWCDVLQALVASLVVLIRDEGPDLAFEVIRCSIPDDHIAPRRSALFMARWVLTEARDGSR